MRASSIYELTFFLAIRGALTISAAFDAAFTAATATSATRATRAAHFLFKALNLDHERLPFLALLGFALGSALVGGIASSPTGSRHAVRRFFLLQSLSGIRRTSRPVAIVVVGCGVAINRQLGILVCKRKRRTR